MATCGSVDDGKSTLIGRLLYDMKQVSEDQLSALQADSRRYGTRGDQPDFALLLDGLMAEREQGITIDVAWRFFSTGRRRVIVADAPGHEQYTRNMITGASTADAALVLVDARKGIRAQTRRHASLLALMGVPHVVLAVNKMDLVGFDEARFREIERDAGGLAAIPLSAAAGDNVVERGTRMPWYRGPTLLEFIDTVSVDEERLQGRPLRLPVQWVSRPHQHFRGYAGTLASGVVRPGDRVRILPSGRESTVARIVARGGDLPLAVAGQSIMLTLADPVDVTRGDVIAHSDAAPGIADQFEAMLVWMDEAPMLGGRPYLMKIGTATAVATPAAPKYRVDPGSREHLAARKLEQNDVGACTLSLDRPVAFDAYAENREMGGFILIDRLSNRTVGAGMLHFALRRAHNLQTQPLDVGRDARAALKGQRACVVWLTGLSGAGKSTLANLLDRRLHAMGRHSAVLDGDNVRHGLSRDLGFTDADRVENVRRVAEAAKLMADAGLIVIVSLISPYQADRRMARERMAAGEFVEIFVDTSLAEAERRDPKGLYRKARRGELKNFTGVDAPYEAPQNPELRVDTLSESAERAVERILDYLARRPSAQISASAAIHSGDSFRQGT